MLHNACYIPFKFTIPGGWLGLWFDTDHKASLSPAELSCCWNWAGLSNYKMKVIEISPSVKNLSCKIHLILILC